jgi:hypothetical protein
MSKLLLLALLFPLAGTAVTKESPFACNVAALTPAERHRHFDELGPALRAVKTGLRELPNGYEFRFPSDRKTTAMLLEWADQERLCCPFFDVDVHFEAEGGSVWLRLTGRAGTKEFIKADFLPWMK